MLRDIAQARPFRAWLELVHAISNRVEGTDSGREESLMDIEQQRIAEKGIDGELGIWYGRLCRVTAKAGKVSKMQGCGAQGKLLVGRSRSIGRHVERVGRRQKVVAFEDSESCLWRN